MINIIIGAWLVIGAFFSISSITYYIKNKEELIGKVKSDKLTERGNNIAFVMTLVIMLLLIPVLPLVAILKAVKSILIK